MNRDIPSLDGLRAISIFFVVLAHLYGTRRFVAPHLVSLYGEFGVRIFFVISGYLITSLLRKERERTGALNLGAFYFRRAMRLGPAFLVYFVAVLTLARTGTICLRRGDIVHALTYTMNFHFNRSWFVGHLWSLSVEEQFYLLWPAIMALYGTRRSVGLAVVVIAATPLVRISLVFVAPKMILHSDELFFTIDDALASGCLLALLQAHLWRSRRYTNFQRSKLFWLIPLSAVLLNLNSIWRVQALIGFTIMNLLLAMTIDQAIRMPMSGWGRLLNNKALRFVGVLSYSLYLWQQLFLNRDSSSAVCAFPQNVLLSVCVAAGSYFLIERPSLRLREIWCHELRTSQHRLLVKDGQYTAS